MWFSTHRSIDWIFPWSLEIPLLLNHAALCVVLSMVSLRHWLAKEAWCWALLGFEMSPLLERERERDYKTKHWVKECRMLQEKSSYILTLKYVAVIWITALTRAFVVFFGWYTNAHIRGRSYRACGDPIEVCGGCYRVHERFVRSLYVVECCSFEMSHTRAFVTVLRGSV